MKNAFAVGCVFLLLGGYGAYCLWASVEYGYWLYAITGGVAALGCAGLLLHRRWSEYVVYVVSFAIVFRWGYTIWHAVMEGWPYPNIEASMLSLLPGVGLVFACIAASFAAFRSLRTWL